MTFFKVSFSSDSLEGLNALSGLASQEKNNTSTGTDEGVLPPPAPISQSSETLFDGGEANPLLSPPPGPEGGGVLDQGTDLVLPPPLSQSLDQSVDTVPNSDPVGPPPVLDTGNQAGDMSMGQQAFAPPPFPEALMSEAGSEQEGDSEQGPPPKPTKRKPKRSK